MSTKIAWTDESWNPVVGCTKVSEGCKNCYAEKMARRFWRKWHCWNPPHHFDVTTHPERLEIPLHWRKPRRIFVVSMGDLFHEKVPFEFIDKVMAVIVLCHQHIFQILTKRPERKLEYFSRPNLWTQIIPDAISLSLWFNKGVQKPLPRHIDFNAVSNVIHSPLPNLWLGITCENQKCADERIPILLQIPAAVRFVSIEPCLSLIHFYQRLDKLYGWIDWVIVGCESGPKRRPCKLEWVRHIVQQCQAAGVPVFVKQLSINGKVSHDPTEWPEDLKNMREYPK